MRTNDGKATEVARYDLHADKATLKAFDANGDSQLDGSELATLIKDKIGVDVPTLSRTFEPLDARQVVQEAVAEQRAKVLGSSGRASQAQQQKLDFLETLGSVAEHMALDGKNRHTRSLSLADGQRPAPEGVMANFGHEHVRQLDAVNPGLAELRKFDADGNNEITEAEFGQLAKAYFGVNPWEVPADKQSLADADTRVNQAAEEKLQALSPQDGAPASAEAKAKIDFLTRLQMVTGSVLANRSMQLYGGNEPGFDGLSLPPR
jgi:hypothetical protein